MFNDTTNDNEDDEILLAAKMRNIILTGFQETSKVTEKVSTIFAQRERFAAIYSEKKRLIWLNEYFLLTSPIIMTDDDALDVGDIEINKKLEVGKMPTLQDTNNSRLKRDENKSSEQVVEPTKDHESVTEENQSDNKHLQTSDESDPDVEKTIQLLGSIRDLLHSRYLENNKKNGSNNEDEPLTKSGEAAHIDILRQLGYDVSQFDPNPLKSAQLAMEQEREDKKQERRNRIFSSSTTDNDTGKNNNDNNIWAAASKIVISSSDDDDDEVDGDKNGNKKPKKTSTDNNNNSKKSNNHNAVSSSTNNVIKPLATPIYNLDASARRKQVAAVAGRSRVLALVGALQFQASAAALGEREAQRRNTIMLDAFHEGWTQYRAALDDFTEKSLYVDYVAAKRNHEIYISPSRGGGGGSGGGRQQQNNNMNNDQNEEKSTRGGYPELPSRVAPSNNKNDNNLLQVPGLTATISRNNSFQIQNPNMNTITSNQTSGRSTPNRQQQYPPSPSANNNNNINVAQNNSADEVEKKLALYRNRKNSRNNTPSPHRGILATHDEKINNGNNNNNPKNAQTPTKTTNENNTPKGGFLEAWKNTQNKHPNDFKHQLEALKREIARRPTPTRIHYLTAGMEPHYSSPTQTQQQQQQQNNKNNNSSVGSPSSSPSAVNLLHRQQQQLQKENEQDHLLILLTPTPKKTIDSNSKSNKSKTNSYLDNEVPVFVDTTEQYYASKENAKKKLSDDEKVRNEKKYNNGKNNIATTPKRSTSAARRPSSTPKINRDQNGKILLTPSPPRNNKFEIDDEDDDEELKIQMLRAKQPKKDSPSYSAHQRAAARKSQQHLDELEISNNNNNNNNKKLSQVKKTDPSAPSRRTTTPTPSAAAARVLTKNNRLVQYKNDNNNNNNSALRKNISDDDDDEDDFNDDDHLIDDDLKKNKKLMANSANNNASNAVGGWMQISDGDVRLTWTRRFLRYDPSTGRIYCSARDSTLGKVLFELVHPALHHHHQQLQNEQSAPSSFGVIAGGGIEVSSKTVISVRKQHAHIVSPFSFVPSGGGSSSSNKNNNGNKFFLLNVSQDHFFGGARAGFGSGGAGSRSTASSASGFVTIEPPDPAKYSKNGVTLTMQSYSNPMSLATVVLCAETQVHAVMWCSALKSMQLEDVELVA